MKRLSDKIFAYFPYLFSLIYFFLLMFIETSTIYAFQNKSFLLTGNYLASFLTKSGGLLDYLGVLLSESLRFNFIGALVYSLITLASILLYKRLLQKTGVTKNLLLISLYPFIFLTLLTFNHFHPLAMNLKLLTCLLLLQFLIYSTGKSTFIKILSGIALVACWYMCGLEFFIFTFSYFLIDTIIRKSIKGNIVFLLSSLIAVSLLNTFLFYTPLMETFLDINEPGSKIPYILPLTYLLFIVTPVTSVIKLNTVFDNILQIAIILVIGYFLSARSFNNVFHNVGKILVAEKQNDYNEVLLIRDNTEVNTVLISAYTNMALLHKRKLLDQMFRYNQGGGRQGLFPSLEYDSYKAFVNMKICLNLGLPNQAIRWAMEATSNFGYNTEILKHLIQANLLNNNIQAAEKYFSIFEKSLFNKQQKKQIAELLENVKKDIPDKSIVEKRILMPQEDFYLGNDNDKESFAWALNTNDNKKAFEWYIAICLLENDHEAVREAIPKFREFGYNKLPVHVQEAMCLFFQTFVQPEMHGYEIDQHIMENYKWFFNTLRRHNNDLQAAQDELMERTGNTYWFYRHYISPVDVKK